ncbi:D-mannonate dehydratase [Halanaerobium saccharolyticum]|uniref:Mannonate dehydratase n=2 Tax=Halanaerobium saccharolyticum TaxID=43595 RepID=A0A4R7YXN0_9FIRM|nr:mannonate dehydratase [Halanaerobium saccharolyticum]RAK07163.1 D-mannonate dehydratase [Halanaerobium saccharolyticum]TDW02076.1 D-mannonate dehydratase [Halanaerobium saccharolyticum]TDX58807.1 D-mannonate dehydratase [Halanaerobium saccharolyticum]
MIFRWFGENDDSVSLKEIKQIPGVTGVVSALSDIPVGEVWPVDKIKELKNKINDAGLELEVIESVNVHEDIKVGLASRDKYIENYKITLENLASEGIKVVCYNFMPVFDWLRSDLAEELEDGSTTMSYDEEWINNTDPVKLVEEFDKGAEGFSLPGWEPERLAELKDIMNKYENIDENDLFDNLKYFLEKILPVCEENDIKMAIHPDDPPWPIYGLPRIMTGKENIRKFLDMVDNPYNGLALCSGSLGSNPENSVPGLIREFGDRIHFGHVRNLKFDGNGKFHETSHLSSDGSLDLFEIMKAYYDIGFDGYIRPDHGRMIWDEKARPGYGLYDRALGATYINGLWEAIIKMNK